MQKFSDMMSYRKLHRYEGLMGKIPVRFPDIYLGVEVEAENINGGVELPGSWTAVEDGSLKVNGMEFVTVPIRFKYLEMELRRLFAAIPQADFSPRTSIHVHMNARDLTVEDLHKFMLLYMVFERFLYTFSGDRWTNNFCVPIYDAPKYIPSLLGQLSGGTFNPVWSKYMGLNIIPLYGAEGVNRIGTIEFRQMLGNNSVEHIMDWCNLITCLKFAAKKLSTETIVGAIITNNTSNKEFIHGVFGSWSNLVYKVCDYVTQISACTSKTKYFMYKAGVYNFSNGAEKKVKVKENGGMFANVSISMADLQGLSFAPIPASAFATVTASQMSQPFTAQMTTSLHPDPSDTTDDWTWLHELSNQ